MDRDISVPLLHSQVVPACSIRDCEGLEIEHTVLCKISRFQYHNVRKEEAFAADSPHEGMREYNRKQLEAITMFEEVEHLGKYKEDSKPTSGDRDARYSKRRSEDFAVNASNVANVILLLLKVYATVESRSLAIAASTLDSLLDLLAGGVLLFTHWSMRRTDKYKYPIGKLRVQPVGIIVFAAVMATLGFQVLIQGVEQLIENDSSMRLTHVQRIWLITIMGIAIVVKLALYIYCKTFKNEIIQAYAMDHYFDVVTNIAGLAAALLADRFFWWIDPIGAIGLALYTIINWSRAVYENAESLVGKSAPPEVIQKLTYMALHHHHAIRRIDTVRAYTFGSLYFVEVDIELPEDMPLKEAHDIGQLLQDNIEKLPEVERAFVHLDFESQHKPEHQKSFLD